MNASHPTPGDTPTRSADELAADLKIHQVELEMQNQELREAQARLETSRQRYFALFDLSPVPYFVFTAKHAVSEMNLAAGELLGAARSELWQRPFAMHLSEESRPAFHEHLHAILKGLTGGTAELRIVTRNGGLKQVIAKSTLLSGFEESPPQVLTACFDVTAARESEAKQKELEAELRQSQKMEALGQLAGGMAHDFNNILQAITGFADLALDHPDPAVTRQSIEEIHSAALRASNLTRQILAFTRRQPLDLAPIDLNSLLTSIQPMLHTLVRPGVQVIKDLEPDVPPILANSGQIEQIIINLLLNACDAMTNGGIVEIRTTRLPLALPPLKNSSDLRPRDAAALTVRDTGSGIPPETLSHIFEPFFTTKSRSRGTGLGLAVVHGIVRQHNGEVRVQSRPGEGTTFTILLPATTQTPPPARPSSPTKGGGNGRFILFAEDEPSLRQLGTRILEQHGFRVLSAADGLQAVELYRRHTSSPISLLIFDVMMPHMNGTEAYQILSREPHCPPILLVSGFPGDMPVDSTLSGTVRFLRKPFRESDLLSEIGACLGTPEHPA